jgi:hypothetical protein
MINLNNLENKNEIIDLSQILNIDDNYIGNFIGLISGCSSNKVKSLLNIFFSKS